MNRTRFYTYIIIIFAVLVWPFTAAGEDLPLASDGKVRIPETLQQQLQQQTEAFKQQIDNYFDTFKFIPAVLLLNAIVLTYCWSTLNKKIQCILVFCIWICTIRPLYFILY